jgi:hypothetical protein
VASGLGRRAGPVARVPCIKEANWVWSGCRGLGAVEAGVESGGVRRWAWLLGGGRDRHQGWPIGQWRIRSVAAAQWLGGSSSGGGGPTMVTNVREEMAAAVELNFLVQNGGKKREKRKKEKHGFRIRLYSSVVPVSPAPLIFVGEATSPTNISHVYSSVM